MGKKQDRLLQQLIAQNNALQAQYNQAMQAAQQQDPYTKRLADDATAVADWAKGGDFSWGKAPKGLILDLVDPTIANRQRQLTSNTSAAGTSALGTPNATLLGLNKQNLDDQWSGDTSMNYQRNVSNAVGNAKNVLGSLGNQETNKRFNILSGIAGMADKANDRMFQFQYQQANKPSGWGRFFGGLAQGGIGALGAL